MPKVYAEGSFHSIGARVVELTLSIKISTVMSKVRAPIDAAPVIDGGFADRASECISGRARSARPDLNSGSVNRPIHRPFARRECRLIFRGLHPADQRLPNRDTDDPVALLG
jgi:hypothetical protein